MFASELTTMIDAGAGLIVGTVDGNGAPRGVRAWAAWVVDPDAQRLRVVLTGDDRDVVANLADGRVALTAADVRTLRSVQMKGRVSSIDEPTPADLELAEFQTERFFVAVSQTDGNPMEMLVSMLPSTRIALEMIVDEQYDQTPGPTAGTALQAGRT
ncbi:MAG TPA: pyridoxamine 5'-phosphate oxidase family protein [Ilumatobacter sp.]